MNQQYLTVEGMHCEACKALITMELEDAGLEEYVESIKLIEGQNQGEIVLKQATEEVTSKIIELINGLENYQITS